MRQAPASASCSENPFSAHRVRPGAIAFQFPPGQSPAKLIGRLEENGWCGQIVGAHGSGKSALVATLVTSLEQLGRRAALIELHDGQRRLPPDFGCLAALQTGAIVIVDGYEQLGLWSRFRLRRFCRRRGLGLVVTAHASVGLPDLFRTASSLPLARQILHQLLETRPFAITSQELQQRFQARRGNLREVLFDLYDLYEQRRRRTDRRADKPEA